MENPWSELTHDIDTIFARCTSRENKKKYSETTEVEYND